MNKPLTPFQQKALSALSCSTEKWLTAAGLALALWPDSHMHSKSSNQGNGACRGKAAWLAGGAYGRKLEKMGYTRHQPAPSDFNNKGQWGYWLTKAGEEALMAALKAELVDTMSKRKK